MLEGLVANIKDYKMYYWLFVECVVDLKMVEEVI